ncbi:hypothetical protein AR463_11030 [Ralstonia solanacearum]|nr:hypothetical protein KR99_20970 [Ralstonia solanacearum]OCQ56287.1 hypothetical protein AR463_11030 [Ralstonia solanacearum]OCQ74712.1 hypothetical protein AR466_12550 [Ralstonia solanacearum]
MRSEPLARIRRSLIRETVRRCYHARLTKSSLAARGQKLGVSSVKKCCIHLVKGKGTAGSGHTAARCMAVCQLDGAHAAHGGPLLQHLA